MTPFTQIFTVQPYDIAALEHIMAPAMLEMIGLRCLTLARLDGVRNNGAVGLCRSAGDR